MSFSIPCLRSILHFRILSYPMNLCRMGSSAPVSLSMNKGGMPGRS
jgi:hypothetical protein